MTNGVGDDAGAPPDDAKRYADPHGLYGRWFDALGGVRDEERAGSVSYAELGELWRRWFAAAAGVREGSAGVEKGFIDGMASLWEKMAEDAREKMLSGGSLPENPVEFFVRWYQATGEQWSEMAEENLKKEEALESGGRRLEAYARSYEEFRRSSEEVLKALQVPSRSDVARVARLVRDLEEKFDALEDALEEAVGGLREAVGGLDDRMGRLEGKIERLLTALESPPQDRVPHDGAAEGPADAPG